MTECHHLCRECLCPTEIPAGVRGGSLAERPHDREHCGGPENGDTEQVGYYTFNGHSASLAFTDKTFGLTGCAGYAQARLYVNVTAYEKGSKTKTTLYGKPFSIG